MQKHSLFSNLIKEPLFHFLLIGAGLFLLFSQVNINEEQNDKEIIIISKARTETLTAAFTRERGRFPTSQEINNIIENDIAQEVLYREAIKMRLDVDDAVIRRRLAQKMKYIFEDLVVLDEPTDIELQMFIKAHASKFTLPATLSFTQVYFDQKLHNGNTQEDLKSLLRSLNETDVKDAFTLGDRSLFAYEYVKRRDNDVVNLFGQRFSKKLFEARLGNWEGPFPSAYGLHFVYVYKKDEAALPPLSQIREDVVQEYKRAKQQEANDEFYKSLRDRYEIRIDDEKLRDMNISSIE